MKTSNQFTVAVHELSKEFILRAQREVFQRLQFSPPTATQLWADRTIKVLPNPERLLIPLLTEVKQTVYSKIDEEIPKRFHSH